MERVAAGGATVSLPPDVQLLLQSSGFNSNSPNSALLAVIGDVHLNLNPNDAKFTDRFDDGLVAELNSLTPAISDLAIAGDLIVHHSVSIGGNRYSGDYALSRLEFREARNQLARFRPDMRVYAVPGNHDTDRYEVDAELWREEFQLPPYQKSILGGVPVFFLNSGHAGMPNPAQIAWFEKEARLIPPDQEVVIIAHHPSFFYVFEETGLRRVVSRIFSNHRAPIWLVGGHGHGFSEQFYGPGTVRFVQMEVTNGNPKQWGDGRSPGYVLIALQDGRVIHRAFRSILEPGFQSRQPLDQVTGDPLKWPFDSIEYPAAIFEEGFYNRTGRLIDFAGVDLHSHFVSCRSHTVRVDLSGSRGKIVDYLMAANVYMGYAPPTCYFSTTGTPGSWESVSFPPSNAHHVYRIPIPPAFRNSSTLYIKTETQLQGPYDGIPIYGWGLAADPGALTRYEKWLAFHYKTILQNDQAAPTAKPAGSSLTNIEHFAFNIPLPFAEATVSEPILATGSSSTVSGPPVYSKTFRSVMDFRFARRTPASQTLVSYAVETSPDLKHWTTVEAEWLSITPLDTDWEEVRYSLPVTPGLPGYCRARVTSLQEGQGGSTPLSLGDLNADGIDDLLQYAFELQVNAGGLLPYDPQRPTHKAGIPVQSVRSGMFLRIVYPRLREAASQGLLYRIEETSDLRHWTKLSAAGATERVIRSSGDWDEVETVIMDSYPALRFYRIGLELTDPPAT